MMKLSDTRIAGSSGGIAVQQESPLRKWRRPRSRSVQQPARACSVGEEDIYRTEAGGSGLIGEVQDYLTEQGENVSWMAGEQSAYIEAMTQKGHYISMTATYRWAGL